MWSDPTATEISVRIRIHSGSAFDPQSKEGVMKLLAESIFPTAASREFYSEDLGGTLEIVSNYDYIQINTTAKSSEFLTLLETLSQAVSNPAIDRDTTDALKKKLREELTTLSKDPAYVADRAVAKRLFGTFPYGRPQMGSLESLERIDFADLLFAKERFLSADNATVAITGNFNTDVAYRAARRYLGAWLKSDKRVPSTFKQPDDPDTKPHEVTVAEASRMEFRRIRRGVGRSDKDYFAAEIFSRLLGSRLDGNYQHDGPGARITVVNEAFILPGAIVIRGSASSPVDLNWIRAFTEDEVAGARAALQAEYDKRPLADKWLDVETYKLTSVDDDQATLKNVRLADVQRVAERILKNPEVTVIVKQAS
jgi:predicted Zn-dependent peptidase